MTERFTIRPATSDDEPAIARLVIEGFVDKFRPVFGRRMDLAVKVMEKWVELEHTSGGVRSLMVENRATGELAGSVGVRTEESADDVLSRGLWSALRRSLGLLSAVRATVLLSYPGYAYLGSEAYVERLVVVPEFRRRGIARGLLHAAEALAEEAGKNTVGLHVSGNNLPALKLYEAEGYAEVSRQRSWITSHFLNIRDWIYLRKKL